MAFNGVLKYICMSFFFFLNAAASLWSKLEFILQNASSPIGVPKAKKEVLVFSNCYVPSEKMF